MPSAANAYFPDLVEKKALAETFLVSVGVDYAWQEYRLASVPQTIFEDYSWNFPFSIEYGVNGRTSVFLFIPYASSQIAGLGAMSGKSKGTGLGQAGAGAKFLLKDSESAVVPEFNVLLDLPTNDTTLDVALGRRYNAQDPQGLNMGMMPGFKARKDRYEFSFRAGFFCTGAYGTGSGSSFNPGQILYAGLSAGYMVAGPLLLSLGLEGSIFGESKTDGIANPFSGGYTLGLVPSFVFAPPSKLRFSAGCEVSIGDATFRSYNTFIFLKVSALIKK